jgi:DNA-binding MarR family transcriptional regulator
MAAFKTWLSGSLSLVHLHVLTILEAGGPQSMSRLADALDVSLASATGIVDRMERRKLVQRRPDPDDRRMVVVHMLDGGSDIFRTLAEHRRQSLARLLDRLSAEELSGLLIGLRGLRAARQAEARDATARTAEVGEADPRTKEPGHAHARPAAPNGRAGSSVGPATGAVETTAR